MSIRKITSLTTLLSFLALGCTSVVIFLAPRGPGSSSWEALGMRKHDWLATHTNLGVLFLVAGAGHLILNIKPIIQYLKNREGKTRVFSTNLIVALALTLWVLLSSILHWPPVDAIQKFKMGRGATRTERVEHAAKAEEASTMPMKMPLFRGGRSLERVCEDYDLDVVAIVRELRGLGVDAQADWPLKKIAAENGMETRQVYDVLRQLQ